MRSVMNPIKVIIVLISSVGLLSGCHLWASSASPESEERLVNQVMIDNTICVSASGMVIGCDETTPEQKYEFEDIQAQPVTSAHPLTASNNSVMLSEYIEQLATELLENGTVPASETYVGVTTFVEYTPQLSSINLLGNMLSEEFIYQLQQTGIAVVDYKVISSVNVQPNGDFVFSRDPSKLDLVASMDYVLTGTTMYNKRGLVVNARIVHLTTKRVVAAAKRIIPYFVLDSIIPAEARGAVISKS